MSATRLPNIRYDFPRDIRKDPTYRSWCAMRTRCTNPKQPGWKRYGGRGITFCARWDSFDNFFADMGPRPEGTTLDRRDNDGNYEPSNCRWATKDVQSRSLLRDRVGQRFGKLLVVSRAGYLQHAPLWNCVCDCGNAIVIRSYNFRRTNSCGCIRRETARQAITAFNMARANGAQS